MQDQSAEDAFAEASFEPAAQVTIQTASGAMQNLDDDLTEEEREICRKAAEYQDELKQQLHARMMAEAGEKDQRRSAGTAALSGWHQDREGQISLRKQNN